MSQNTNFEPSLSTPSTQSPSPTPTRGILRNGRVDDLREPYSNAQSAVESRAATPRTPGTVSRDRCSGTTDATAPGSQGAHPRPSSNTTIPVGAPSQEGQYNGFGRMAYPTGASGSAPYDYGAAPPHSLYPQYPHYNVGMHPNHPPSNSPALGDNLPPTARATAQSGVATRTRAADAAGDENRVPAESNKKRRGAGTTKSTDSKAAKGGRPLGTKNWTQAEDDLLFEVADEYKPLGGDTWQVTTKVYNERGEVRGLPLRDCAQIKRRFKRLVSNANAKKPTGKSKKAENLRRALAIDEAIRNKYGAGVLDDDGGEFESSSEDDTRSLNTDDDNDVEVVDSGVKKPKPTSTFTLEKRHRIESGMDIKPRARSAAAMNAITNLSSAFDPERLQQRDDAKAVNQALLLQIASEQAENRRLHAELDRLRDELAKERVARADERIGWERERFDLKLQSLTQQARSRSRGHARRRRRRASSSSDDSPSRSPSSSHRKKQRIDGGEGKEGGGGDM